MSHEMRCTNLKGLLSTERAAIHCHLDARLVEEPPADRREAVRLFIEGYGGLMRELYCAHICADRARCEAIRLRLPSGVLLREQAS